MTTSPDPHSGLHRDDPIAALIAPIRPLIPQSRENRILFLTLAILALWGLAILTLGVPALVWPLKLIVPALVLGLIVLTQGM